MSGNDESSGRDCGAASAGGPGGAAGDGSTASRVETILAAQLHVSDVVRQDGALRRVTSLRLQGAPPEVCVELSGLTGRLHYRPTAHVKVLRRRVS